MNNPYEVLGVSETATDEEVKAAYRNLAKKYHPDNYTDSPLADVAEQKMKEINEAYDMINQMRQKGKGTGSTGSSSYNANSSSSQFYNVRIYIQRGLLDQADQILENTAQSMRTAEWHYLKGMIAYRRGWSEQAFSYFTTACNMDPNNTEYRAALNNMQNQRAYNYGGFNPLSYSQLSAPAEKRIEEFLGAPAPSKKKRTVRDEEEEVIRVRSQLCDTVVRWT